MQRSEKLARLRDMLRQVAPEESLDALVARYPVAKGGTKAQSGEASASVALRKIAGRRGQDLTNAELISLEAIVMPAERPVVYIRKGVFDSLAAPWTGLNGAAPRRRLQPLFASIGRIELPNSPLGFGGTGFVVGSDLIMTNRHVAKLFAEGVGTRGLTFRRGDAAICFTREIDDGEEDGAVLFEIRKVEMIHPYWDMALLRVDGLPARQPVLRLSARHPDDFVGREVVVVGYPARDNRNDLALQDRIFGRFDVKRLQPGKVKPRALVRSFDNEVLAMIHDCSTLGGNSGSAVIDVASGEVIGLHFGGRYLEANYAVPTFELARDSRVVGAHVGFRGRAEPPGEWMEAWSRADGADTSPADTDTAPAPVPPVDVSAPSVTWTIPLRVSVSIGGVATGQALPVIVAGPADVEGKKLQVPIIHPGLESRTGYQPDFLSLDGGDKVLLPRLTAAGKKVVSTLDDGSAELKYHRFSIFMHKRRRLALFTAANVDWRKAKRLVNGHKPTRSELSGIPNDLPEGWVTDPRIPQRHQLPDEFFTEDHGAFDKGHLVRRDDVCWGSSFHDIQKGNGDTYHTTNCSPQTMRFNQGSKGNDNWGDLEDIVEKQTAAERVCIFSGPVLDAKDSFFHGRDAHGDVSVQIPRKFWKIIVAKSSSGPQAFGFVLEQDLSGVPLHEELIVPVAWKRYMHSVAAIEDLLHGWLRLGPLKSWDQADTDEGRQIGERLSSAR